MDAFTDQRFGGNPCAVVFDADDADEDVRIAVTRESRLSECAFLQASDIADVGVRYYVATGEIGVLRGWREDHLERFGHHDPERGLLIRGDGELINPQTTSQGFDRAVARTDDLPRLSLHGLRHTHATLLLKAGGPLKVVSERLGHSTRAFTMATYQQVLPGMQAEAAAFADLLDQEDTHLDEHPEEDEREEEEE